MKVNVVVFSMMLFLALSCRDDKGPLPVVLTAAAGECDTVVYYTDDIAPIMEAKCSTPGCHVAGFASGDLTTYAGVKAKVESGSNGTIKSRVDDKTMPPAGSPVMTDAELKKLDCWIKQGYSNNSKNPSASGSTSTCSTTISYSINIAPIISANCSSVSVCHGTGSNNGDYSAYTGLSTVAGNGLLYNKVVTLNDLHNPPVTVPPLSAADISKINCWIQQSFPNN